MIALAILRLRRISLGRGTCMRPRPVVAALTAAAELKTASLPRSREALRLRTGCFSHVRDKQTTNALANPQAVSIKP